MLTTVAEGSYYSLQICGVNWPQGLKMFFCSIECCVIETGGHCKCAYKCAELAAGLLEVDLLRLLIPEDTGPLSL